VRVFIAAQGGPRKAVWVGAAALFVGAVSGGCRAEYPVGTPVTPRKLSFVDNPSVRPLAEYVCRGADVPEMQLADDSAAFASLWRAFELTGPAPRVDFSSWLVLGFSEPGHSEMTPPEGGGHCQIDGFALREDRLLIPTCQVVGNFIFLVEAVGSDRSRRYCKHVLVAAIARSALPTGELALGLSTSEEPYYAVHRFTVTPPPPVPEPIPFASATWRDVTAARDEVTSEVALPAVGDVCLAELTGGVRAWVVRHGDQTVSVIAGDYPTQPVDARVSRGEMGRRGRSEVDNGIWGVSLPTRWYSEARMFSGVFDEYGSPIIATLNPLDQYEFRPAESSPDSIGIGKRIKGMARASVAEDGGWPTLFPDGTPAYPIEDYRFVVPAELDTGSDGLQAVWADLAGDARGNVELCDAFEASDDKSVGLRQGRGWIFRAPPCFERLRPRWLSYHPILPAPKSGPTLPTYAGPFLVELRRNAVVRLISLMQDRRFLVKPSLRPRSRRVAHCQSVRVERYAE
jgi:hypothetical protein